MGASDRLSFTQLLVAVCQEHGGATLSVSKSIIQLLLQLLTDNVDIRLLSLEIFLPPHLTTDQPALSLHGEAPELSLHLPLLLAKTLRDFSTRELDSQCCFLLHSKQTPEDNFCYFSIEGKVIVTSKHAPDWEASSE